MVERRDLLRGFVALPLAAVPTVVVSGRVMAGSADPFKFYHQRILALHDAINAGPGEDEAGRMMGCWGDIDREALAGHPTTFAGAAGALDYLRREFVQFSMNDIEKTDNPSHHLILHLLDGALGVLRQAVEGGAGG